MDAGPTINIHWVGVSLYHQQKALPNVEWILARAGDGQPCVDKPHCFSPISVVPKRNKNLCLIQDLVGRLVNDSCRKMTFQCEAIKTVVQVIEPKDESVTLDIKNGFHHIQIHESHRKCLGFFMEKNIIMFGCVLPFGLANSPDFLCKSVLTDLTGLLLWLSCYKDDFLLMDNFKHSTSSKLGRA